MEINLPWLRPAAFLPKQTSQINPKKKIQKEQGFCPMEVMNELKLANPPLVFVAS